MTTRLDNLVVAHSHFQNGVGRVDDAPDFWREGEERNRMRPGAAPARDDWLEFLAPRAGFESIQLRRCRVCAGGGVNRLDGAQGHVVRLIPNHAFRANLLRPASHLGYPLQILRRIKSALKVTDL